MKQARSIEEQIRGLRRSADAETHHRILGELRGALRQRSLSRLASRQMIGGMPAAHRIVRVAVATAAAVVAMALLICLGDGVLRNRSAYAGVVKALQDVNAIHVLGWTTRLSPGYSVAGDDPYDRSQRYPIEIWEWFTSDGGYRLYDRQGPIVVWDDGDRHHEHHADKDRLFVSTPPPRRHPYAARFQSMTENLESLKERGIRMTNLGIQTRSGRRAEGLRTERGDRRYDLWIDVDTHLVLENDAYTLKDGQWRQDMHREIRYNQAVPTEVVAYVPPNAKDVQYSSDIDPRFDRWNQRLRRIAAYYQGHPVPAGMELLPCDSNEGPMGWAYVYAPGTLPGITDKTGHWVMPLRLALGDFLQSEFKPIGSLRVPADIAAIRLNHDLVTKNGDSGRSRSEFVLGQLGLELVETIEPRKVWIAHHDGRPLKPWRQVKSPVPNPDGRALRPGMASSMGPATMRELLDGLVFYQAQSLAATGILIIDQTGLPSGPAVPPDCKGAVAAEQPYWGGEESPEIAREWFQEQFGVTFTQETRPMTIYGVRRRL